MSIDVRDLTVDDVDRLTKVLCRRPEYGVAIPSGKWLRRQEEKAKHLSKHMLRPTNPLKRFVMKLADSIDPAIVDPQAVLCQTHAVLNPWLVRRLFMAVAYEVTVHSDSLRSWNGRTAIPELSAFVGRLDAVNALWTEPGLYHECYGTTPFQNHMIYVKSGCEACILGAVGANAQVLADLRAIIVDRIERRLERSSERSSKGPRLARVVGSWIDHLGEERAARCRGWSDSTLVELRATRPEVMKWRSEQKKEHQRSCAARQTVYTELRRGKSGHHLSTVPSDAQHRRRTRNGIPMALADREGAEEQRWAALRSHTENAESVFRPDSLCEHSQIGKRQRYGYDTQTSRPAGPEPVRASGQSQGSPTESFIEHFEREVALDGEEDDAYDDYDYGEEDGEGHEDEDRNLEHEARGRVKVRDWYATRLAESVAGAGHSADDAKSVLSLMHPAFQPNPHSRASYTAPSAVPEGLGFRKDLDPHQAKLNESTGWTNATVYTVDPSVAPAEQKDLPPVPRVPSQHRARKQPEEAPPTPRLPGKHKHNKHKSEKPLPKTPAKEEQQQQQPPLNWPAPAPPQQQQQQQQQQLKPTATRRSLLFPDSEAGSRLSATQKQYLRERRAMRDFASEDNPFTRAGPPEDGGGDDDDGYMDIEIGVEVEVEIEVEAGAITPSLARSHGDTIDDDEELHPDDSISNVPWRREKEESVVASETTSWGGMRKRADEAWGK